MSRLISYIKLELRYFINWLAGVVPFSIQYVLFVPVLYTVKTLGAVQFESARFVNVAFQYLKYNKIVGDYAEFGVFKGGTTIEAVRASNRANLPTKFFLFDSFQGLPELSGTDLNGPFESGEFSYSKEDFLVRMRRNGIKEEQLHIVEGFYSDSLPKIKSKDFKFSLVFIDCDLLESTREVLLFLKDKLAQGAIIAFDDYYCYSAPDLGERAAIREWLGANPSYELTDYNNFHWAGKSFIFYDNARS